MTITTVASETLESQLLTLAGDERRTLVDFLTILGELDQREVPLARGYTSTFAYLTEKLGYSRSSAGRRVAAARLLMRFPIISEYLLDGRLWLTTVCMLGELLDASNVREMLDRASGLDADGVKRLKLTLRPEPLPRDLMRRIHQENPDPPVGVDATSLLRPDDIRPVSADLSVFRMTVTQEFIEDFQKLRALVSHQRPQGKPSEVVHDAIKIAIAHHLKKRLGSDKPPRKAPQKKPVRVDSRYIPVETRKIVWERDHGTCAFVGSEGKRCGSNRQLEFDHSPEAFARGGPPLPENIQLACGAHNRYRAKQEFGREYVQKRIRKRSRRG